MSDLVDKPCGCDNGKVLHVYSRGPNSPPGNCWVSCPCCKKGQEYEKEIQERLKTISVSNTTGSKIENLLLGGFKTVPNWKPINSNTPINGLHIKVGNFTPGSSGFGYIEGQFQYFQTVAHYWKPVGEGSFGEEGFYPSVGAGEDGPLQNLTHWDYLDSPPNIL